MNGLCAVTVFVLLHDLCSDWRPPPELPPAPVAAPSAVAPAAAATPHGPLWAERALSFWAAGAPAGVECACGLCSEEACFEAACGLGFVAGVEPVESVPAPAPVPDARPALPLPPPLLLRQRSSDALPGRFSRSFSDCRTFALCVKRELSYTVHVL